MDLPGDEGQHPRAGCVAYKQRPAGPWEQRVQQVWRPTLPGPVRRQ